MMPFGHDGVVAVRRIRAVSVPSGSQESYDLKWRGNMRLQNDRHP